MRLVRRVVMVLLSLFCCLGLNTGYASNGGIYTDLFDFGGANGANSVAALTLSGGVFYGTTTAGGTGDGVIFSFDPSTSTYTDLVNFTGIAGAFPGSFPVAALALSGGVFYGTTFRGDPGDNGVIFSFNPSGSIYAVVHDFDGTNGEFPRATLTLNGGVFYGTASGGGTSGNGVIFSFDPLSSTYTSLVNFTGNAGAFPGSAPLAALTLRDGVFYGTTADGGTSGNGVIFAFDPSSSTYMVVHNFDGTHGSDPTAALTLNGGVFYGTTQNGGTSGNGVIFAFDPSSSTYIDLYDFDGTHGSDPSAALTLRGGIFYGTATAGGASGNGVIFSFVSILPPSNLTGRQKKNNSGARYERFNDLKWQPPTLSAAEVAGYNIYRNGEKIATLPASALHYEDHNRKKGVKTLYSVTTINVQGNESSSANTTVP